MKRIAYVLVFLITSFGFGQNAGFFGSPLSFVEYNNTLVEADNFNGSNLGTITSLVLNGSEIRTFKNGGADVTGAYINYRIYEASSTPGSFIEESIPFGSNLGGDDQLWETSSLGIDLISGLGAGDYKFEVFFRISVNGCCGGEVFQSNSGANYTADFTLPYRTANNGTWSTTSTWIGGSVPPSGSEVVINHDVTLNVNAEVSDITISTGNTLTSESGQGRTLTIQAGGTFTNNGTFTANDGSVSFPGTGTISGSTTFNDVDIAGGVDFGLGSTIDGILTVNGGGFATNSPIYGNGSTLDFDTGGNYNIDSNTNLWTTGSTLGVGVPYSVTTTSSGLNISQARDVTGTLTVDSGASVTTSNGAGLFVGVSAINNGTITTGTGNFEVTANLTNAGTFNQGGLVDVGANFVNQLNTGIYNNNSVDLIIVGSNFENQSGASFTLSNSIGGDLEVKGNFTDNGTFTSNNRAVFFTGSSDQTVDATNTLTIDFILINTTNSAKVQMLQDLNLPNNLTLTNGNLDLNGNTLTISGDIRPDSGLGTIEGSTTNSTLIFDDSSAARTLESGDLLNNEIANLTINESAGITINTDLKVTENLDINAGDNFLEGGFVLDVDGATMDVASAADFTFKSNPADASSNKGDAQLAEITNLAGTTLNGNVTTERYFTAIRAFRLIAPSVTTTSSINANWQEGVNNTGTDFDNDNQNPNPGFGTHITGSTSGANGFDATPSGNPSLFTFDNANFQWNAIGNTDTNTLTSGEAYRLFIRGDRGVDLTSNNAMPTETRIRTTGSLQKGNITSSGTFTANEPHFIGNPYQAAVDLNSLSLGDIQYAFIWDPNVNTRGAYVTVDINNNTNVIKDPNTEEISSETSDANKYLQPQQAIFLDIPSSPTVTSFDFTEASKVVNEVQTTVFSDDDEPNISLRLLANNAGNLRLTDGLKIRFNPNGDNSKTANDARKINNLDESIATVVNNQLISIEERALPQDGESVQLFTAEYRTDDYVIEMSHGNIPDDIDILLTDHYTDQSYTIGNGIQQISFSVDSSIPESEAWNRFTIDFVTNLSTDQPDEMLNIEIYPNPAKDDFAFIDLPISIAESDNIDIQVNNLLGQQVQPKITKTNADQYQMDISNLSSGVYFVKVKTGKKSATKKLIIK